MANQVDVFSSFIVINSNFIVFVEYKLRTKCTKSLTCTESLTCHVCQIMLDSHYQIVVLHVRFSFYGRFEKKMQIK